MHRTVLFLTVALMTVASSAPAEVRLGGADRQEQTAPRIDRWVQQAQEYCSWYTPKWRVDCLRDQLAQVAGRVPKSGAYGTLRAGLWQTVDQLSAIAARNADPSIAPTRTPPRVQSADRPSRSATALRATAPARQARANAAASQVLDELATTLLRAAPQGAAGVQFTATARAIATTKQLLRSA